MRTAIVVLSFILMCFTPVHGAVAQRSDLTTLYCEAEAEVYADGLLIGILGANDAQKYSRMGEWRRSYSSFPANVIRNMLNAFEGGYDVGQKVGREMPSYRTDSALRSQFVSAANESHILRCLNRNS